MCDELNLCYSMFMISQSLNPQLQANSSRCGVSYVG
jgi:hypothetical protein